MLSLVYTSVLKAYLLLCITMQRGDHFVFHGLSGLLVSLNSPTCYFFVRMYQMLDLTTPKDFCYLSDGFVLIFQPNNSLLHWQRRPFELHIEGWQQQILNANATLEITYTWARNRRASNCQITFCPLIWNWHIKSAVIPLSFTWFVCKHFELIFSYSSYLILTPIYFDRQLK